MKKIAIVGGGFSGLSLAYHLLKLGEHVTLFDGKGIGGGASGIASGLLHPYPGEVARLSWKGEEGLAATKELLELVGEEAYKETGILRLALSKKQEKAFRKRALERDDVEWWDAQRCQAFAPGSHFLPGIFIRSGITVHASLYLKGLWAVCKELGGQFENRHVDLQMLKGFDQIALCSGSGIRSFLDPESSPKSSLGKLRPDFLDLQRAEIDGNLVKLSRSSPQQSRKRWVNLPKNFFGWTLDVRYNKGQVLISEKPSFLSESSLIGKGYIALSEKKDMCYLGSTYEHSFLTESPCLGIATDLIFKQIGQFLPSYGSFKVKGCLSEIRVSNRKSYHPLIGEVDKNLYVMTAMGSRGLLYHGYLGKILAHAMKEGKEIPNEVAV